MQRQEIKNFTIIIYTKSQLKFFEDTMVHHFSVSYFCGYCIRGIKVQEVGNLLFFVSAIEDANDIIYWFLATCSSPKQTSMVV